MIYKKKNVRPMDLYKWIGKTIGVNDMIVRDVIYCFSDAIRIAVTQGYDVTVPRVGVFTSNPKQGVLKGEQTTFKYNGDPKDVMKDTDEYTTSYDSEKDIYVRTYLKNQPDFRSLRFKVSPSLRDGVREESKYGKHYE